MIDERKIYAHPQYLEDIEYLANLPLPWEKLQGASLLLSGGSGLIGSYLVDALMRKNERDGLNCAVYLLGRNEKRSKERFVKHWESPLFHFHACDINAPLEWEVERTDYALHLASNTHPVAYAQDPIGTVTTNVIGTKNMLDFAVAHGAKRFVFVSSNEIYGENRGDSELFDEEYCGYINCNTLRAGYPESKRCGEALCQAYARQKGLDIVIPRLTRSYGATVLNSDTKAISQFIQKGVLGEDIILKSAGEQYYSYTYAADAVAGLLTVTLLGERGEAYNVAEEKGDIRLKDLAKLIADFAGKRVVFELPSEVEKAGYSVATKARLDGKKLQALGWTAQYDVKRGVERTLQILRACRKEE